jgi:hypothetical protein
MLTFYLVYGRRKYKQVANNEKDLNKIIGKHCRDNGTPVARFWEDEQGYTWVDFGSHDKLIKYRKKRTRAPSS